MNRVFSSITHRSHADGFRSGQGFTLIELMVAMLLGLIVIAGVASVFLANLRSYHTNTALGDVQSNARIAYELLARDIRQAGLTGCNSRSGRISNVLDNGPNKVATPDWWADWTNTVHGYAPDQTDPAVAASARAANTDSVILMGATGAGSSINEDDAASAKFTLNEKNDELKTGDIVLVCNPDHVTIMQATDYDNGSMTVTHASGDKSVPGNCSAGLGYPTDCSTSSGNTYTFTHNSQVARLEAHDWYIGTNPVGGKSLYRVSLVNDGGALKTEAQEMVRNVTDMQILYHQINDKDFVDADGVTSWPSVDAIRITLTLQSADQRAGTDSKPLTRKFTTTTTIRNRVN